MLPGKYERDHKLMQEVLADLTSLLQKRDVNWSFELLDLFWSQLAVHIRAENVCLFPAILNAPREAFKRDRGLPSYEEVKSTIDSLRGDHTFFVDQIAQVLRRIRELLAEPEMSRVGVEATLKEIQTTMEAVAERLETHWRIEEKQVYRWPELLLTRDQYELLTSVLGGEVEKMPRRVERLTQLP
jgi:hypothetical protein